MAPVLGFPLTPRGVATTAAARPSDWLPLEQPGGSAGLLYDVRELVRDEALTGERCGRVLSVREVDIGADGVGVCAQGLRGEVRRAVGVHPNAAEVVADATLHVAPHRCLEWRARPVRNLHGNRPTAGRNLRLQLRTPSLVGGELGLFTGRFRRLVQLTVDVGIVRIVRDGFRRRGLVGLPPNPEPR
jgi:hypothetical protein